MPYTMHAVGRRVGLALGALLLLLTTLWIVFGARVESTDAHPGTEPVLHEAPTSAGQVPVPVLRGVQRATQLGDKERDDKPAETVLVVVRDLADGAELAGVEFEVNLSSPGGIRFPSREKQRVTTDQSGHLQLDPKRTLHLSVTSDGWSLANRRGARAILESGEAWLFRTLRISARVEFVAEDADKPDLSAVRLKWLAGGIEDHSVMDPPPDPWNARWVSLHGLSESDIRASVDDTGQCELDAPGIRGLVIRASVPDPGWKPAVVRVPLPTAPENRVVVALRLERAWRRVHGRVLSADDSPRAGAIVKAYVLREIDPSAVSIEELRLAGFALAVRVTKAGKGILTYVDQRIADSDGKYEFSLPSVGAITLVAHAEGHAPARAQLLRAGDDHEADLAAVPSPGGDLVTFTYRDKPLGPGMVTLTDFTDDPLQTHIEVPLDKEGRTRATWLERDRDYWILVKTGQQAIREGFLRWDERTQVEMSSLETNMEAFLRARPKDTDR